MKKKKMIMQLEALAVDNARARFVVFFLGDPHGLGGGEGSQDGATDPYGVLALRGSNDLDLDGGGSKSSDLLLHAVSNTSVHGGATGQNDVGHQVLADVDVAPHDGVVDGLVNTSRFHTQEGWLEESLRATETLVADGDDLTVGKFVGLVDGRGGSSGIHLRLEVKGDVAKLFLDVTDNFTLSGGGEGVTTLSHDLHQVVGDVTTSQVQAEDGVGKGETFVDGDHVGHTITGVANLASGTTRGVQGEHSLDTDIGGGNLEGLEHDLGHLLTVGLGVQGSFSEEGGRLFGGNAKLIVEGMVPDLLHVVPVGDDAMLNGVLQGEDTTLALCFITNVGVLLTHTDHHTLVTGAADDGGEDGTRGVVAGEASLDHAGAIVAHERYRIFIVAHGGGWLSSVTKGQRSLLLPHSSLDHAG